MGNLKILYRCTKKLTVKILFVKGFFAQITKLFLWFSKDGTVVLSNIFLHIQKVRVLMREEKKLSTTPILTITIGDT